MASCKGSAANSCRAEFDSLCIRPPFLVQEHTLFQRGEVLLCQPLTFGLDPVVVAVGRQSATIGRGGFFQSFEPLVPGRQFGARQRSFELGYVEMQSRIGVPADRTLVDDERVSDRRQAAPQGVQKLAQVGLRLAVGGVGPEEKGQLLARLRGRPVQKQIGQQGLNARAVQAADRLTVNRHAELAEESDLKRI